MNLIRDARTFAARQHRVELSEVLSNPFARPVGWAILLGGTSFIVLLAPLLANLLPMVAAIILAYVAGVVLLTGIWHLSAPILEARSYRNATHRWLLALGDQAGAGAYATADRSGHLTLYSVWADPRGQGHGGVLIEAVIADTAPDELWLTADNKRVAAFYRRHGFVDAGRRLTGHRMKLSRRPAGESLPEG